MRRRKSHLTKSAISPITNQWVYRRQCTARRWNNMNGVYPTSRFGIFFSASLFFTETGGFGGGRNFF